MRRSHLSLSHAEPTNHERLSSLGRYQGRLKWWRRFLYLFLLLSVCGVGIYGWRLWGKVQTLQALSEDPEFFKKDGMYGLTLHMHDKHPMEIRARAAIEIEKTQSYNLDRPQGRVDLPDGAFFEIESLVGRMDQNTRHLTMTRDVKSRYTSGYTMRTEHTFVDLPQHRVHGECYVEGKGPTSAWTGEGFVYQWEQEHLQLKGPATLTLIPSP